MRLGMAYALQKQVQRMFPLHIVHVGNQFRLGLIGQNIFNQPVAVAELHKLALFGNGGWGCDGHSLPGCLVISVTGEALTSFDAKGHLRMPATLA